MHVEDYSFSIINILKEGLRRSEGVKWTFNIALSILFMIQVTIAIMLVLITPELIDYLNLIITIITLPIIVGLTILGINRAREIEIKASDIFNYLGKTPYLIGGYIAVTIITAIGFLLLILPGIYLSVAYTFTLPLIADKNLGVWEAMELSRKTITKQWFRFFGLALTALLFILVSAIPLGIGLIWSVPAVYITYGLLYHHLFDEDVQETFVDNADKEEKTSSPDIYI